MIASDEVQKKSRRKIVILTGLFVVVMIGVIAVFIYLQYKKTHITTDDAFVDGRIHVIAPKVPGTVETVCVQDNEHVEKGTLLVKIDDRDYVVRVKQSTSALHAEASKLSEIETKIDVARTQLSELRFVIESAKANLVLQQATLRQAQSDLKRAKRLFYKEILPEEQYEKAETNYDIARARVETAREQLRQSEASLTTHNALIRQIQSSLQSQKSAIQQKEALLKAEDLKRSYTELYAPADGYITKKTVEAGNQIQSGQPLMAVVALDDVWITANYKETQLGRVSPGQRVKITIDTYPAAVFWGRVHSIMAGTGSSFSLFPPENATGNFVKIVQRIPVKIVLEKKTHNDHVFRIGMSVVPTIIIED